MNICFVWISCALLLIGGTAVMSSHSANRKINIHDLIALLNSAEQSSEEKIIEKPKKHAVKISAIHKPIVLHEIKRILHPEVNNKPEVINNNNAKPITQITKTQQTPKPTNEKHLEISTKAAQTQPVEQKSAKINIHNHPEENKDNRQFQPEKQNNETSQQQKYTENRRFESNDVSKENEETKSEKPTDDLKDETTAAPINTSSIGNIPEERNLKDSDENNNSNNKSEEISRNLIDSPNNENEYQTENTSKEKIQTSSAEIFTEPSNKRSADDNTELNKTSSESPQNDSSTDNRPNLNESQQRFISSLENNLSKKLGIDSSEEDGSVLNDSESENNNRRLISEEKDYEEISPIKGENNDSKINHLYDPEERLSFREISKINKKDMTKQCDLDNLLQVKNFKLAFNFKR